MSWQNSKKILSEERWNEEIKRSDFRRTGFRLTDERCEANCVKLWMNFQKISFLVNLMSSCINRFIGESCIWTDAAVISYALYGVMSIELLLELILPAIWFKVLKKNRRIWKCKSSKKMESQELFWFKNVLLFDFIVCQSQEQQCSQPHWKCSIFINLARCVEYFFSF